jgi:hypothetical protein
MSELDIINEIVKNLVDKNADKAREIFNKTHRPDLTAMGMSEKMMILQREAFSVGYVLSASHILDDILNILKKENKNDNN